MANPAPEPPIDKQVMRELQRDLNAIGPMLAELVQSILAEGATQYPVFVASEEHIGLGLPAFDKEAYGLSRQYRVSPYEELIKKGLIQANQVEKFKAAYSHASEKACVLVVDEQQAYFVFVPVKALEQAANADD